MKKLVLVVLILGFALFGYLVYVWLWGNSAVSISQLQRLVVYRVYRLVVEPRLLFVCALLIGGVQGMIGRTKPSLFRGFRLNLLLSSGLVVALMISGIVGASLMHAEPPYAGFIVGLCGGCVWIGRSVVMGFPL